MFIDPQVAGCLGNRLLRFNGQFHGALFKFGWIALHRWFTHRTHLSRVTIALVSVCPVEYSHINYPASAPQLQATQVAARALGVQLQVEEMQTPDAFESAFATMTKAGADALFVLTDPLLFERHASDIVTLALKHRLPSMYSWSMYTDAGGLMFYNMSLTDAFRRVATYVDKILKGAKPADLPVEQPMKF